MKGRKCSIIFMRKVANRLDVLEERYKDLPHQERAKKINEDMKDTFCVGEREIRRWKSIVKVATKMDDIVRLPPHHYTEIAKLPEEKQREIIEEVANNNLTYEQTALLVDKVLGKQPKPLPNGKYRTIVIDPPYPMEKLLRDCRPNQQAELDYRTMTIEEIKNFPIRSIMADDCHIYLWVTHKYLPIGFEIFKTWGIHYECLLTWVKNVGFTPYSWMYSTEHVLFGRKGNLPLMRKGLRLDFQAKVREHSRKPDEFYELIKQASPEPRIDVFAREKHEGFEVWGNEVTKFELRY
jgi:N6-adenosine-specific RNA methylase IME4